MEELQWAESKLTVDAMWPDKITYLLESINQGEKLKVWGFKVIKGKYLYCEFESTVVAKKHHEDTTLIEVELANGHFLKFFVSQMMEAWQIDDDKQMVRLVEIVSN